MTRWVFGARYARLRELLVDVRRKSGLTQVDVAASLRRPQRLVSKVESGERRLDVVELIQYANAIGEDAPEIVREVGRTKDRTRPSPRRS